MDKAPHAALLGIASLIILLPILGGSGVQSNPKPQRRPRRNTADAGCHQHAKRADYLFPDEGRYPVPTRACAHKALAYASWPNNLYDAPRVVQRLFSMHPEYRFDPALVDQAQRLIQRYEQAAGKKWRAAA